MHRLESDDTAENGLRLTALGGPVATVVIYPIVARVPAPDVVKVAIEPDGLLRFLRPVSFGPASVGGGNTIG